MIKLMREVGIEMENIMPVCKCGDSDCDICSPVKSLPTRVGEPKLVLPPARVKTVEELKQACRLVNDRTTLMDTRDAVIAMANHWGKRMCEPELVMPAVHGENSTRVTLPRDAMEAIVLMLDKKIAALTETLRSDYGLEGE